MRDKNQNKLYYNLKGGNRSLQNKLDYWKEEMRN